MKLPVALSLLLVFSALAADVALKYEQPRFRTAYLYSREVKGKELFKLNRSVTRSGNLVKALREFVSPDGTVAARERITYEGDKFVGLELEDVQIGGHGSAKVSRENGKDIIAFEYTTKNGKSKTGSEKFTPETIVNDMVNPFLVTHWKQLMNGEAVKCRYMALTRAETVGFEFTKVGERNEKGMPVVIVKMAASSFIIAALVNPLVFTIEKNGDHRVLNYDGITTPKFKDGEKFKDLEALTVFDW
jgi:hypothetical protein